MYTDIKTYEDAARKKGIDPTWRPDYSPFSESYRKSKIAEFELDIIIEQMNDDPSFPDYSDDSPKYELWLWVNGATKDKPSGSGLSILVIVYAFTRTHVGSRRKFKNREMARYCFETFKQKFIDSYLNNQ